MVVFGLASMVKVAFGEDVSFVVVTKMAFILNASPPFSWVLPSGPPCISLFAPRAEHMSTKGYLRKPLMSNHVDDESGGVVVEVVE
jgi:hypothetical protein